MLTFLHSFLFAVLLHSDFHKKYFHLYILHPSFIGSTPFVRPSLPPFLPPSPLSSVISLMYSVEQTRVHQDWKVISGYLQPGLPFTRLLSVCVCVCVFLCCVCPVALSMLVCSTLSASGCVLQSVCVAPGESVRDFKALAGLLLDERAVPMFIVTCFST